MMLKLKKRKMNNFISKERKKEKNKSNERMNDLTN